MPSFFVNRSISERKVFQVISLFRFSIEIIVLLLTPILSANSSCVKSRHRLNIGRLSVMLLISFSLLMFISNLYTRIRVLLTRQTPTDLNRNFCLCNQHLLCRIAHIWKHNSSYLCENPALFSPQILKMCIKRPILCNYNSIYR